MTIFPNIGLQGQYGSSSGGSISSGHNYGYNTSSGSSYGEQSSIGESWGSGWGYETGSSHSAQQSASNWGGYANGESYGQTFGREASAQDVENAYTANSVEREMWALQAIYNAQEAEKNRQYQAYMSNTAYQRATQDLIKAGLNPILAAGTAASSPVGATAVSGLSSAHKANAYADSISASRNSSRDWGTSRSSGYSESSHKAENGYSNGSYNKSHGYNKSENSSYGYSTGQNSARSWENSQYNNNVKDMVTTATKTLGNMSRNLVNNTGILGDGIKQAINLGAKLTGQPIPRWGGGRNSGTRAGKY